MLEEVSLFLEPEFRDMVPNYATLSPESAYYFFEGSVCLFNLEMETLLMFIESFEAYELRQF